MTMDRLETLRDEIFAALARGDETGARKGIKRLRRREPIEAAGLLTALHIEAGRVREALAAWRECAKYAPRDPYTIFLHARIHLLAGERSAALDLLTPLLDAEMPPAIAEKVYNLAGQCARFLGRAADAVRFYERARDAAPDLALRALNASNVLFNRHYLPSTCAEDKRAAEGYGALFSDVRPFDHGAHRRGKRLRIGYLSPDVREHVVLSFSYALMTALDSAHFEVTVYALNPEDAYTENVKRSVDHFRNLSRVSTEEARTRSFETASISSSISQGIRRAGHCRFSPIVLRRCRSRGSATLPRQGCGRWIISLRIPFLRQGMRSMDLRKNCSFCLRHISAGSRCTQVPFPNI